MTVINTLQDLKLSCLMSGTAQLGFDYGIANRGGQPPYETARDTHWTPKGAKLAAETVAQHR